MHGGSSGQQKVGVRCKWSYLDTAVPLLDTKHLDTHAEFGVTAYLRRPAGTRLVPNQRFLQTTLRNVESGDLRQYCAYVSAALRQKHGT